MKESRQIFIREQQEKMKEMMICLMRYRLHKDRENKDELRHYFHSLNGTCAMLQFENLSDIGKKYEKFLDKIENDCEVPEIAFSTLLEGLATAYEEIERITEEYDLLSQDGAIEGNLSIMEDEYINMTNSGTILIVDDDIALLNQLEKVFTEEGYRVLTIADSQEVMTIVHEEKIDIIILDVMMPKIDGFSLLTQLKREKSEIPIIFLSAKTLTEDKVQALNHGADDYITKPFELNEVVARVDRVLKRESDYKMSVLTDELTGAYTKKYFRQNIKEAKERLMQKNESFSIAFIDIDHFKQVNDIHGHITGDYILKKFTDIFKKNLRQTDQIYRFGGDEFLVLFQNTQIEFANSSLERIRKEINKKPFFCKKKGQAVTISFSAGVTSAKSSEQSIDELLQKADQALYDSKQLGRERITIS